MLDKSASKRTPSGHVDIDQWPGSVYAGEKTELAKFSPPRQDQSDRDGSCLANPCSGCYSSRFSKLSGLVSHLVQRTRGSARLGADYAFSHLRLDVFR